MSMDSIQLISPPMITYKGDIFGMIPSPPIGLACLASYIREHGFGVSLLDCFGISPFTSAEYRDDFMRIGLGEEEILNKIDADALLVGISVHSGMTASFCLDLALQVRKRLKKPVVVGGPHASVTYGEFLEKGVDFVVIGEGEDPLLKLLQTISAGKSCSGLAGIASSRSPDNPAAGNTVDMNVLPFPAWDLVPLENYWALKMSHSPVSGPYAPMITSRGCPFNCAFCSTPKICGRKWRCYSPGRTMREVKYLQEELGIQDIFIQDDNFNHDPERVIQMCNLFAGQNVSIRFSLPSGVRLEKMNADVIDAMARGGFHYLCLAPESGSAKVRNRMRKPLDEGRLMEIQKRCRKRGIRTGAFLIIGTPSETIHDVRLTAAMMARLLWHGMDDVSIFIYSPVPGSSMAPECEDRMPRDYLGVCWSPKWRKRYDVLSRLRMLLYLEYIILKMVFQPLSGFRHLRNIIRKKYETKGEMGLSRLLSGNVFSRNRLPWRAIK
jgi:anaerobic magnesium-protoporphyrin IX monomethyl ester cyclase